MRPSSSAGRHFGPRGDNCRRFFGPAFFAARQLAQLASTCAGGPGPAPAGARRGGGGLFFDYGFSEPAEIAQHFREGLEDDFRVLPMCPVLHPIPDDRVAFLPFPFYFEVYGPLQLERKDVGFPVDRQVNLQFFPKFCGFFDAVLPENFPGFFLELQTGKRKRLVLRVFADGYDGNANPVRVLRGESAHELRVGVVRGEKKQRDKKFFHNRGRVGNGFFYARSEAMVAETPCRRISTSGPESGILRDCSRCGGIGRHAVLRGQWRKPCRFESGHRHHRTRETILCRKKSR